MGYLNDYETRKANQTADDYVTITVDKDEIGEIVKAFNFYGTAGHNNLDMASVLHKLQKATERKAKETK